MDFIQDTAKVVVAEALGLDVASKQKFGVFFEDDIYSAFIVRPFWNVNYERKICET